MARCLVILALFIAGVAPAIAQPTFRSGVDLVRFDVRVVDDTGRPITDLRSEELEILENGRPLPLVLFQRVTEPAESYVDAALRAVTAEVSSNDAFPRGHLYILIFDQQHITPGNEQRARMAAEHFIRRRVRPSDRVALFAIPGPGPQIGFTADTQRAIKALDGIRGAYERSVSSPLGRMTAYEAHRIVQGDEQLITDLTARLAIEGRADVAAGSAIAAGGSPRQPGGGDDAAVSRRLLQENARAIVNQTDSASRQFLQRLADVIAGFRDIDGRKTVVLFSEGFFQDNLSRELETVAAAAAQSYCVFYALDLNQRGVSTSEAYASETTLATEIQSRIAPMATLAVETDGMLVLDASARSEQALDQLANQAQDYYLVGFTPSDEAQLNRGKYRRVSVRVKRPGARASARTGYALRPAATAADRRRAIDTVLGAPFVQQGLKVDYTTYVMKAPDAGRHRVVLSLSVDLPVRAKSTDTADVVFVVRDTRDGRVVASGADTIPLPATARTGAVLGTGTWRVQFDLAPGPYLMRTVVREPGGLIGSADRRVEVRPLDGPEVTVSDLVIGSALAGLPVRPRVYTGEGVSGVLETYGRTPVQLQGLDVKVELRKPDDGTPVASLVADVLQPETSPSGVRRRVSFMMPLRDVVPGHYLAHAVVTARGEIVAERTRQVEVLGGAAPPRSSGDSGQLAPEVVSPLEVTRGDLARSYILWLRSRAQGTPAAEAAQHAIQGDWAEVEVSLQRVPEDNGVVRALRGLALFSREDYEGAAKALERARDAEPHSALTAFFLGWAYEGAGEPRAALGAWRSAAHLDPSLVSAHLALADGYLRLSEPLLAVQALKAGLAALPSSPELLARLGQIERGGQ